ncbi:MAG TPA: 23S rRNA (uracil(1939)-C(5))-methyltransferase RlmD [Steroidobacteraceae bacterium]|jgi:23S rRNA (uracil1939-C5)-methyltransferase
MARKLMPEFETEVVDLAHDGRGVAKHEGKALFVAGALPGERVRVRLLKRRRQFDEAALLEVLVSSPDRVEPRCAHFGLCGGCSLQHLAPASQLRSKQQQLLQNLERIGGVRPANVLAPLPGPAWSYRRRARLGVKFVHKKGRVLAGFREREKPYLADLKRCEILIDGQHELPTRLAALAESLSIKEALPQVELAAGDDAVALVFRVMREPSSDDLEKLSRFAVDNNIQAYLQPGGLDSVRPLKPDTPPLTYRIDSLTFKFGPSDFVQVNAAINASMVQAAIGHLAPQSADRVLDLFCGLGNFTLPLARRCASVLGVEGDAALIAKARQNAADNQLPHARFAVENLFEPKSFGPWSAERYDLVLLDPPRAGAQELLPRFKDWQPRRIVYISCHPGSLARDAGILVRELGFSLKDAGVMDMFPHTTHVESIAVFEAGA